MGGSTTSLVRPFIAAAWRRRYVVMWVVLAFIPISLTAALTWPKAYSARALILLQEQGGINTGVQSYAAVRQMQQTVSGIDALLKSEFILSGVLHVVYDDADIEGPEDAAQLVSELRDRLEIEWVGDQFVEITLSGGKPEGLGIKLDAIIARVFESLLSPVSPTVSAPGFLLRQRKDRVQEVEARLAEFLKRAGDISAEEIKRRLALIKLQLGEVSALKEMLQQREAEVANQIKGVADPEISGADISSEIKARETKVSLLSKRKQPDQKEIKVLTEQIDALKAAVPLQEGVDSVRADLAAARQKLIGEQKGLEALRADRRRRAQLQERLQLARAEYSQVYGRFKEHANAISLLNAPAQVKVVDAPKEPTAPLNSSFVILIAGLGIGLVLSVILAFLRELMDLSLRGYDDLVHLSELPVVGRFNRIPDFDTISETLPTPFGDGTTSPDQQPELGKKQRVVGINS